MTSRTLASATLAGSLLALDVVLLTLYLNPGASLAADARGLLLALFLPYAVAAGLLFALSAALGASLRGRPRPARPTLPGLPGFTAFTLVAQVAAAALFWHNLLSYRHSIPVESVRALAGSAVS